MWLHPGGCALLALNCVKRSQTKTHSFSTGWCTPQAGWWKLPTNAHKGGDVSEGDLVTNNGPPTSHNSTVHV
eukprot:5357825-Amphidinium_carterae.2